MTDKPTAEEELAAAQRELAAFRAIADRSSDFIIRYDHDLRVTYVNPSVLALTNSKAEEVLGRTHRERGLPEALCGMVETHVRGVFATGLATSTEYETSLSGEQVIVQFSAYPEFDESGAVFAVCSISRDLTLPRQAASAARTAERKLRSMADTMPAYFAYVSLDDLVYRFVNRSFEVGFGRPREEIVGKHIKELIGESNYAFALPYIEEVRRGRATHYENTFGLETGKRWARVNYVPDIDEHGAVVGIVVLTYDVTEQRRIQQALEESVSRFRLLSESSPVGVFQTDPSGALSFANRRWSEITGRSVDDGGWLDGVHPDDRNDVDALWQRSRKSDVPFKGEFRFQRPNGEARWVLARIAPVQVESGEANGYVGVIEDVTDSKAAEAQQLRAQKLESVGVLAGGIAHDFNNLLTTLLGTLGLARMEVDPGTKVDELLEDSENACDRAVQLTNQLLTFARGGEPVKKVVRLGPLIEESVRFALRGSAVACEFTLADELWFADVDEGQIGQLLHNLVLNAEQAMPRGGMVWVEASNTADESDFTGSFVKITIRDEGPGIPPELIPKIFDPYFTTKRSGQGLGLAMCHSIVTRHGGAIHVHSRVDVGTTFEILLPRSQKPLETHTLDLTSQAVTGRGRVLVMDDEETVLQTAGRILSRLGYDASLVEDGDAAFESYQKALAAGQPFDVVILDLTVRGGVGGLACLERLRAADPNVRAIVSSGYSNDPVLADHERYGFSGTLPKPFRVAAMATAVARLLP